MMIPRSSLMRNAVRFFSQICELLSCAVCIYNRCMEFLFFDDFDMSVSKDDETIQNFEQGFRIL